MKNISCHNMSVCKYICGPSFLGLKLTSFGGGGGFFYEKGYTVFLRMMIKS